MKKIIILSCITLSLLCCSLPDELGLPSWITTLKVIFLNDTYDIEELAEEDSALVVIGNELVFIDSFQVDQMLGDLQITDLEPRYYEVTCADVIPDSLEDLLPYFSTIEVPPFVMDTVVEDLEPFAEYEEITFETGVISLELTNNCPLGIGDSANGNPLSAVIMDTNTEEVLLEVQYDDIAPNGGEGSEEIELAGLTFPNDLTVILNGGSTGSEGEEIYIDDDFFNSSLEVEVELQNIYVSSVVNASIPLQELETIEDDYEFDIEYPEIVGDYSFTGFSEIRLKINSVIPGLVALDFSAVADEDSLTVILHPLEGSWEHSIETDIAVGETELLISSENYNLNEFLSILPQQISYTIYPSIGDTTQTYTVQAEDELNFDIRFSSNIQIQTEEEGIWIIPREDGEVKVFAENMEDFDQEQYDAFQSGSAVFQYLNTTGIEMGVQVLIADDRYSIIDQIYTFNGNDPELVTILEIPDIETTQDSIYKQTALTITQEDLDFFLADSVYIGARMHFFSDGQQPLANYLSLIGELHLEILISEDLTEEGDD